MTIIAYRYGIMACDSCWTDNDTWTVSHTKIVRLKSGALLGCAGDNDCRAMYDLLDNVRTEKQLPSRKELAATGVDFSGLLALPKGGVWYVVTGREQDGHPKDKDADHGIWPALTRYGFAATGSGWELAFGAMRRDLKCSAAQAAKVACEFDINCREPIHTVTLKATSPRKR